MFHPSFRHGVVLSFRLNVRDMGILNERAVNMKLILCLGFLFSSGLALAQEFPTYDANPNAPVYHRGLSQGAPAKLGKSRPIQARVGLPSAFDWRTITQLSPVMNQQCEDCWAHSTASTMADAIAVTDHVVVNPSPQYVISCNKDGYTCAEGGNYAFELYQSPLGMIYESQYQ